MSPKSPDTRPPPAARALLEWFCREDILEEVLGDIEESYLRDLESGSPGRARMRFWKEVLLFIRPHALRRARRPSPGPIMLRNYLQVTVRFMRRHKVYSAINLVGLAVGIAATLLIARFVLDERSFDAYLPDADRVFRLVGAHPDADFDGIAKVNGPYGPTAAGDLVDVEASARFVFFGTSMFTVDGTATQVSGGFFADSTTFDVFAWPLVSGNASSILREPRTMILTRSLAETLFGEDDPVGRFIRVGADTEYRVSGLMEDVPASAHFRPTFLAAMSGYTNPSHDDWIRWNQYYTYLKLRAGADPARVEADVQRVVQARIPADQLENLGTLGLQPVLDIYLRSNMFREIAPMGSLETVRLLTIIGAFILLLAALNFINLATARATLRAREVGVRKSLGARRSAVMRQFLTESAANVTLAAVAAVMLSILALPTFNTLSGKAFTVAGLLDGSTALTLVAIVVVLGILAGAYPAFVLSGFRPAAVMRGASTGGHGARVRKGLVLLQFVISTALLMSTGIVADQLNYLAEKPLGFEQENLLSISLQDPSLTDRLALIEEQFAAVPGVESVSFSGNRPGGGDWGIPVQVPGVEDENLPAIRMLVGDSRFTETFGMRIRDGRTFDPARPADVQGALLVNQELARQVGWTDALGQRVLMPAFEREFEVIGVVEDFHFRSAREAISPLMIFQPPAPNWFSLANVRIAAGRTGEALAGLEEVYGQFDPVNPFQATFMDSQFQALYTGDQRTAGLLRVATLLAFLVACLGLFGLASHAAERRTREIGVRRAIGASVSGIVALLTRETLTLVAAAVVLAMPLAVLFGREWLASFVYHTPIQPSTIVFAALAAVGVALLTTGLQSLRAARLDPVRALRIE